MATIPNDWINQLCNLPPEDRADIAYRLISSLDEPVEADWETAWAQELQKRADRLKSEEVQGVPFEEVMANLRQKYT